MGQNRKISQNIEAINLDFYQKQHLLIVAECETYSQSGVQFPSQYGEIEADRVPTRMRNIVFLRMCDLGVIFLFRKILIVFVDNDNRPICLHADLGF